MHDHMEHILTNLDLFAGVSDNLIDYTFNVSRLRCRTRDTLLSSLDVVLRDECGDETPYSRHCDFPSPNCAGRLFRAYIMSLAHSAGNLIHLVYRRA